MRAIWQNAVTISNSSARFNVVRFVLPNTDGRLCVSEPHGYVQIA